jgi:hypothetical protein
MKPLLLSWMAAAASVCLFPLLLENASATTLQARGSHLAPRSGLDTDALDHSSWRKVRRNWKIHPFALHGLHKTKLSKQVAVHIAFRSRFPTTAPQIFGISSIVCVCAANLALKHSEAAQRACFFWKRAGPIVAHYKFTQVSLNCLTQKWWLSLDSSF